MPRAVIPSPSGPVENGPDLAGWREAQDRLREALGEDVTFSIPLPKTYDESVALDPETGEPYDPTVVPTSGGGFTSVIVRATVVFHPIKRGDEDQVEQSAVGMMDIKNVALLVGEADYPGIQDAAEFVLHGRDYRITDMMPDGLVGIDRYVVYGAAK